MGYAAKKIPDAGVTEKGLLRFAAHMPVSS
jgi:hypothetical protein